MSSKASPTDSVNCIYCKSGIRGVDKYREHLFEVHRITADFVQGDIQYGSDITWVGKEGGYVGVGPTNVIAQPALVKTEVSGENSAEDENNVNNCARYNKSKAQSISRANCGVCEWTGLWADFRGHVLKEHRFARQNTEKFETRSANNKSASKASQRHLQDGLQKAESSGASLPASLPPYIDMVKEAISTSKSPNGLSRERILSFIMDHYKVGSDRRRINAHLKKALMSYTAKGVLKCISKGQGSSHSFKLARSQTVYCNRSSANEHKTQSQIMSDRKEYQELNEIQSADGCEKADGEWFKLCRFDCRACTNKYETEASLVRHIKVIHGVGELEYFEKHGSMMTADKTHCCRICGVVLQSVKKEISRHLWTHNLPLNEYSVEFMGVDVRDADVKRYKHNEKAIDAALEQCEYTCAICAEKFPVEHRLFSHVGKAHKESSAREYRERFGQCRTKSATHACRICSKEVLHTKARISAHLWHAHSAMSAAEYKEAYLTVAEPTEESEGGTLVVALSWDEHGAGQNEET